MKKNFKLSFAIQKKGLTQKAFAKKVGDHHTFISRVVNGWVNLDPARKNKYAKALGVEVNEIFGDCLEAVMSEKEFPRQYPEALKRLLSIQETAAYLGISPQTIRNEICRDVFPIASFKRGGRRLFDIQDVDRYIDSLKSETEQRGKIWKITG